MIWSLQGPLLTGLYPYNRVQPNPKGLAVIHTNRSFEGSRMQEPKKHGAVAHASAPVMNLTKQIATVRVGVNTDQR
jgi:pyrrolidone-carboxylate peptidase